MNKRIVLTIALTAALAACAAQDSKEPSEADKAVQAVRDLIEVRGLQEASKLKTGSRDHWKSIENWFLIYETGRDTYLVEFNRRCWQLDEDAVIVPDKRWDANAIRARYDTIRGCRIGKIYALNDEDVAELENIGEAPGERN